MAYLLPHLSTGWAVDQVMNFIGRGWEVKRVSTLREKTCTQHTHVVGLDSFVLRTVEEFCFFK